MADVLTGKPAGDSQRDIPARGIVAYYSSATGLTYSLTTAIRHLMATTTSAGTLAVTLPPVAEAAGMIFSVYLDTFATSSVSIADAGDDADFTTRTLDAADEFIVLFSNGVRWLCLSDIDASQGQSVG